MFAISVQLVPLLVDDCHFNTLPVWPVNVNVPLFAPVQTVLLPFTVPAIVGSGQVVTVSVAACDVIVAVQPLNTWQVYL